MNNQNMRVITIFNRLWKNIYIRHLTLAVLAITVIMLCVMLCLNVITQHGQTYPVPDFTNMTLNDAKVFGIENNVIVVLNDSGYVSNKPRGIILEQNPKPQTQVKQNRKIFVRVNAKTIKKATVPAVVNMSLRQAKTILEHRGLAVGKLSFSADLAHGIVLSQWYRGNLIAAGGKLPVGSKIDLEIGQNNASGVIAPSLKGLSLNAARNAIIEAMLNVGDVSYSSSVKTMTDSLNAVVYAQFPTAASDLVPLGTSVDIILSANSKTEDEDD